MRYLRWKSREFEFRAWITYEVCGEGPGRIEVIGFSNSDDLSMVTRENTGVSVYTSALTKELKHSTEIVIHKNCLLANFNFVK